MDLHDLYQSSINNYNGSSRGAREALGQEQAYYEPEILMTGQVWINSGRQPWPLLSKPIAPPKIIAPTLDAQGMAERVAQRVRPLASLEGIYVRAKPWGFECWLVANRSTEAERFHLYDLEWQLMEQAPDFGFKFHLIDRQDRPAAEVITLEPLEPFDAIIVLYKDRHA
jgi:hypothetical protein